MKHLFVIFLPLIFLPLSSLAFSATIETNIVWLDGKAHVDVAVEAPSKTGLKELLFATDLWDAQNLLLGRTALKVPAAGANAWKGRFPLEKIKDAKKQHRLTARLLNADLGIDYYEEVFFSGNDTALVQRHGLRAEGVFPSRKVYFVLGLNAFPATQVRDIPVTLGVRDGEDNPVFNRQAAVKPSSQPQRHLLDVTPEANAVGPFKLEASIDSEGHSLFFNASLAFGQPNASMPFSSMEHGDPGIWFAANGNIDASRSIEFFPPGAEVLYYSPHLSDLVPADNPRLSYDRQEKHSGRQSLRIDYLPVGEAIAWSVQSLPGKPLYMSFWVKGNESQDQLLVHFEDCLNYTAAAWQRWASWSTEVVCTLNYSGWRQFRVPVLGYGLQVTGTKGSTLKIDAPIRVLAFSIRAAPLAKDASPKQRRSIWIDDLSSETQIAASGLLSIECQPSDAAGRLTPDGKLAISVGNGFAAELTRGKLTVLARDGGGNPVWTSSLAMPVPAEGLAAVEVPLAELAAKKPKGPVELEVSYQDLARPAARISRPIPFKSPTHAGIVHDFEAPIVFNSYQPGKVGPPMAKVVEGGAGGSQHALALRVLPGEKNNSVLFHPALPGLLDSVEMMIYSGGRPVTLQPWFIDSGYTGVWMRPYNLFWGEPIQVDWQGWRKVSVPAPAIPPYYGDKRRYFYKQPWYPLNLALNATLSNDDEATELRFDDLRVITHLPDAEQLQAQIEYIEEHRIHAPGSPLRLVLWNFAQQARKLPLSFTLKSYQGHVARSGKLDVAVPAGARQKVTLIEGLSPGMYDLEVQGLNGKPLVGCIMVLDAKLYFGQRQEELLTNPHLLRRLLDLTTERLYLDWDNTEPAPHLFHGQWFESEIKRHRDIALLPQDLQAPAAKQAAVLALVKQTEEDLRTAKDQAINAERDVKPYVDRLAVNTKNLDAAKTELETAKRNLGPLVPKSAAADMQEADSKAKHTEAVKAAQQAEQALNTARQAAATADRAWLDADRVAKTAEAQVKTAQDAAATAAKEQAAAEAELKKAEESKNKDAKLVDPAKKKLEAARKQAEAAKTKTDEAQRLAQTRRGEADKLKPQAEEARKDLDKATAQLPMARKAAEDANQRFVASARNAGAARGEKARAEQQVQAAQNKVAQCEKTCEADRLAVAEREKVAADAAAKAQQMTRDLETARAAAADAAKEFDTARSKYDFTLLPVVGFSADWAGPEAADALQRGTYRRYIPNLLQVPRRMIDWSLFVRNIQREYKGRFDYWVFWENPDLDDAPQGIPARKYAEMLQIFARWVKLYNPRSKVVAGGLNFGKSLGYLRRIPEPHKLPLDEVHVQMNLGELSPEQADVEGYLDDLNALLKLPETKRGVRISELDWAIGPLVTPLQQAAYHARAAMVLDSRGVSSHQFSLLNTGYEFDGYGVFYRVPYGNMPDLQTFQPTHVPKPSYFALIETRKFLEDWKYVTSAELSDRSLADNRAYVYRNAGGELTVALWRAADGLQSYRLPAAWQGVQARDIFGFPLSLDAGLPCSAMPVLVRLPKGYALEQLLHDLRTLATTDGSCPVLLDLHLAEPDSQRRAAYQSTGKVEPVLHSGQIAGDRKVRKTHLHGLETEGFSFALPKAGDVLLRRRWFFEGEGQRLFLRLNDGAERPWDLGKGQGNEPGVRETTFLLRGCRGGANRLAVRYEKPGNCAGYRLEPIEGDYVPLVRWGVLNTRQTRGQMVLHASAVGTPLTFGKTPCADGIGAHATSFIEYPLDGQFRAFEVTVGIDGSTEGRGSVNFRIYVDGKERATSGLVSGFSKPKTLRVPDLEGARRLVLNVTDAEDGNRDDLANWVDGKLYWKKQGLPQ